MKKLMTIFTLLIATCYLLPGQSGVIREINGTVELKNSASSSFITAKAGDQVMEDTVISTGFKSNAIVEVGSVLIAVRPLTRLTLTEIRSSAGTETVNVNLQAGRVRVDVTPPAGTRASMTVASPSATASVRGTSFEFDTRNLLVHEGSVSFHGTSGQRISIPSGSSTGLGESGRAQNPISTGSSSHRPSSPGGGDSSPGSIAGTTGGRGPGDQPSGPDGPSGPSGPPSNPSGPNNPTGPSGPSGPDDPDIPGIDITW